MLDNWSQPVVCIDLKETQCKPTTVRCPENNGVPELLLLIWPGNFPDCKTYPWLASRKDCRRNSKGTQRESEASSVAFQDISRVDWRIPVCETVTTLPVLKYSNFDSPFILDIDDSEQGLEGQTTLCKALLPYPEMDCLQKSSVLKNYKTLRPLQRR